MVKVNRVDSIIFDLKQSIEDLGNELKFVIKEFEELKSKLELLEKSSL